MVTKLNKEILILNWRDIKNPSAGGAEILTHEMAKLWVEWGNSVTQISAKFKGSAESETIDGVKIIRMGSWWTVHILAFFYYIMNLQDRVDVIIDEVHGIPFFSKLYASSKTILFACEVANQLFFRVFPYPIALVGRILEEIYFAIYKNSRVLAISPSTKEDLVKHGFPKKNITVLPMGLTVPGNIKKLPKEKKPTIIYLSRINKQKGIEDTVEAFSIIHKELPQSCLWVVGSGDTDYVRTIKNKVRKLGLSKFVRFFGFVDEIKKFELLSRAHIFIFPSIHEGWGLVIVEAAVCGTPTVVYDVAGVRDVVEKGKQGIMVEKNRPDFLAEAITKVLKDDKLYRRWLLKIKPFENYIGWEKTARQGLLVIGKYEII